MKKIILPVLFVSSLSAKMVYRCYSPFNLPDLVNFENKNECIRSCGGSNQCYPVELSDLELEKKARE